MEIRWTDSHCPFLSWVPCSWWVASFALCSWLCSYSREEPRQDGNDTCWAYVKTISLFYYRSVGLEWYFPSIICWCILISNHPGNCCPHLPPFLAFSNSTRLHGWHRVWLLLSRFWIFWWKFAKKICSSGKNFFSFAFRLPSALKMLFHPIICCALSADLAAFAFGYISKSGIEPVLGLWTTLLWIYCDILLCL